MNKFIPLVSNVENIEKGKKAKDHEISVGVLASEINQDNPKFYASRTGRLYDPIQVLILLKALQATNYQKSFMRNITLY